MNDVTKEGKDQLLEIIETIENKHDVRYIVEQNAITDGESEQVVFKLKKRMVKRFSKRLKFLNVTTDYYVTNELENIINFRDLPQITEFLRLQYSDREGFVTYVSDIAS